MRKMVPEPLPENTARLPTNVLPLEPAPAEPESWYIPDAG